MPKGYKFVSKMINNCAKCSMSAVGGEVLAGFTSIQMPKIDERLCAGIQGPS